jgi:hypothetical protein
MQVVLDERDESGEERVLLLSVVPGQSDHLMLVEESVSERLHNTPEDTKKKLMSLIGNINICITYEN